jgi:hypothetical protein
MVFQGLPQLVNMLKQNLRTREGAKAMLVKAATKPPNTATFRAVLMSCFDPNLHIAHSNNMDSVPSDRQRDIKGARKTLDGGALAQVYICGNPACSKLQEQERKHMCCVS